MRSCSQTYRESQKRIEVQSKTISVAERSYRISHLRFKEGIGSRLELTDAELQLNKAKTNYLQAVYDYLVASVRLDKALGRSTGGGSRKRLMMQAAVPYPAALFLNKINQT